MSAIAGLLRFDGRDVARHDLERMANALRAYGPDKSNTMIAGRIGLAHVLMRMTPDDRFDRQPWRGQSGAIIVADLRLDNRDDVIGWLELTPQDAMTWADSRILLTAWEKFGDALWPKLRGPFSAAIWSPDRRTLTLARDHLGLSVMMWHKNEQFFGFASMPKGLFSLPDVPRELNEEKFADFLVLNHAELNTTFYRNIFRILPAHIARVSADGTLTQSRYWSTADIRSIRLRSDQAYAEGLRECLDRAVRRQLRSAHPVGCYLSGGLDSSAVAALAARALGERNQRLAAFTQVPRPGFDGPVAAWRYADETPLVEAIRSMIGNIDVTYVRNDQCDDFADLERFFLALDGPVRNPTTLGWMLAILRLASARGYRVLLGGLEGNNMISWSGWPQAIDHLLRGRVATAYRQWRLYYRLSPDSNWGAFSKLFLEPLLPEAVAAWMDRRQSHRVWPWQHHAAIRPAFAEVNVNARARAVGHDFLYRFRPNRRGANLANTDYDGDWLAAEKAFAGVESRDPTADIDVVSYCLGIPPEQYLVEGIDRSLIRRAMWGWLPERVLTNRLRGLQSADWYEKLGARREQLAADISSFEAAPLVRKAIDIERLARALRHWPRGDWHRREIINEHHLALTRGIAGGRFLLWWESANRQQATKRLESCSQ